MSTFVIGQAFFAYTGATIQTIYVPLSNCRSVIAILKASLLEKSQKTLEPLWLIPGLKTRLNTIDVIN